MATYLDAVAVETMMKLSHSRFALKGVFLFPLTLLALAVGVMWAWGITTDHAQRALHEVSGDVQASLIGRIHDRAHLLNQSRTSAHHLANWASRLNLSSFYDIEMKVAPNLFFALSTVRWARMAGYVRKNGLSYSYHRDSGRNMTFSVFSNVSDPNNDCFSHLYSAPVDSDTGEALGEAELLPPPGRNLHGERMNNESQFIFRAPVGEAGVVMVGISVKGFADFVAGVDLRGGHQYLATQDGEILARTGPPSDVYVLDEDRVSIHVLNSDRSVASEANISCSFDGVLGSKIVGLRTNNYLTIGGRSYRFTCVPLNSSGITMVSVIAFPCKEGINFFRRKNKILVTLFSFLSCGMIIGSFLLVALFNKGKIKELCMHAMLIKQKEVTQQAERKSMNKSLAFARASHDIRTSLAGITGLIDLCRGDVSPNCQLDKNLVHMNTCAAKLLGILNSVLDISKVEAGKMKLEEVEFNMARVIEESIDIFHVIALRKGVEVIWDPTDCSVLKSLNVVGDCRRFKQILDNLLSNAVKFTSQGHVVVRAWAKKPSLEKKKTSSLGVSDMLSSLSSLFGKHEDHYEDMETLSSARQDQDAIEFEFEVDDTGIGISRDKRASVFENYVQVKESSATEYEGTGLGLGIVQSYVRLMGGEISIKDKQRGERGTCFKFKISLKSSNNAQENLFDKSIKLEGVDVLLLIQGEETKKLAMRWFENVGANVWIANDSELLHQMLEKIRHKLFSSSMNSSVKPEGDDQTLPLTTTDILPRSNSRATPAACVLVLIDLSFGNVSEICSCLNSFAKTMQNIQIKVVGLADSSTPSADLREIKKAQWDLILQKPLHGTRLCAVLKLVRDGRRTNHHDHISETKIIETKSSSKDDTGAKPLSGINVLLVEDTYILQHLTSTMLSKLGATVRVSENGKLALDLVREAFLEASNSQHFPYDVLLMDCEMPIMDGYQATREIRKEEKQYGYHIPIIALTAHTTPEELKKTMLSGMDLHLAKPVHPTKLLEAINIVRQK